MSPLLAVAEALRELEPRVRFLFLGGRGGLEADIVPASGIELRSTPMPSLRDPDSRLSLASRAALLVPAIVSALWHVRRFGPDVCCTSGGMVTLPIVAAARLLGVPVYLWDGDAIPGRANRLLAGSSQRVGATFRPALAYLPRDRTKLTGGPIRPSLLMWTAETGRVALGLPAGELVVLVTGGSQGSERVNGAVFGALPQLLRRAYVVHLVGRAHAAKADARRDALPSDLRERYRPSAFLREEMGAALAAADVVVARAASSSIMEPLAFGKPLVLVPFAAAASGHQAANAQAVVEAGAATVISEAELDAARLSAVVLGLIDDPERLARMASAARGAGRPGAALDIAREVLALGGCG